MMKACAARVAAIDGIIYTVGKHVIAQFALAGTYISVGIEEAAEVWIVISALQIIEPQLEVVYLTTNANK